MKTPKYKVGDEVYHIHWKILTTIIKVMSEKERRGDDRIMYEVSHGGLKVTGDQWVRKLTKLDKVLK